MGVTCGRTRWIDGGGVLASRGPPALQDMLRHQIGKGAIHAFKYELPVQLASLPAWSGKQATLPPLWTYGSTGHCYNMNWREHVSLTNQGRHCIPVYAAKQHRGLPGIRARRGVPSVPRGAGAQCVGSSGGTNMSCSDSSCSRSGLRGRLSCSGAICSQTPRTFAQHLPAMIVPAL